MKRRDAVARRDRRDLQLVPADVLGDVVLDRGKPRGADILAGSIRPAVSPWSDGQREELAELSDDGALQVGHSQTVISCQHLGIVREPRWCITGARDRAPVSALDADDQRNRPPPIQVDNDTWRP